MNKYIDVDEAIENLNNWVKETGVIIPQTQYHSEMISCVEDCKTADVQPVVHARWINIRSSKLNKNKCSNCNKLYVTDKNTEMRFTYCPTCGAKMDGDKYDNR